MLEPITTLDQADRTLATIGVLQAQKAAVQAACDATVTAAKDAAKAQLITETPQGPMPLDEWIKVLEGELARFAIANPDAVVDGKRKSVDLASGTLGFRFSREKIDALQDEDATLQRLRDEVLKDLTDVLSQKTLKAGIPASTALTVEISVNKTGLLEAVDQKRVTPSQLKKLGFKVTPGEDRFFCKPSKQILTPEPAR